MIRLISSKVALAFEERLPISFRFSCKRSTVSGSSSEMALEMPESEEMESTWDRGCKTFWTVTRSSWVNYGKFCGAQFDGAPRDSLTARQFATFAKVMNWKKHPYDFHWRRANLQLLQKSWIGKSIHMTFTDWGYLDLAMAVHLLLT